MAEAELEELKQRQSDSFNFEGFVTDASIFVKVQLMKIDPYWQAARKQIQPGLDVLAEIAIVQTALEYGQNGYVAAKDVVLNAYAASLPYTSAAYETVATYVQKVIQTTNEVYVATKPVIENGLQTSKVRWMPFCP